MNTTHNEVTGTAVFRGPALREKAQKALNFLLPGKNSQELRDQDFWVLKNKQNLPVILNGLFLPNIPTGAIPLTPPTPCKSTHKCISFDSCKLALKHESLAKSPARSRVTASPGE